MIYKNTLSAHLNQIQKLFEKLNVSNITVNISECKFDHAHIQFLGHVVRWNQSLLKLKHIFDWDQAIKR